MSSLFRKILCISQTWYKSNTSLDQWDGSARWSHLPEYHPKGPHGGRRHACAHTHAHTMLTQTSCTRVCTHVQYTYMETCVHAHTRKDRINFMLITQVYIHTIRQSLFLSALHLYINSITSFRGHGIGFILIRSSPKLSLLSEDSHSHEPMSKRAKVPTLWAAGLQWPSWSSLLPKMCHPQILTENFKTRFLVTVRTKRVPLLSSEEKRPPGYLYPGD